MVRIYKPQAGSSRLLKQSEDQSQYVINAVKISKISVRQASELFEMHYSTLEEKFYNTHARKHGCPCVLAELQETALVKGVKIAGSWEFPVTFCDGTVVPDSVRTKI